jgi:hypothetical protein
MTGAHVERHQTAGPTCQPVHVRRAVHNKALESPNLMQDSRGISQQGSRFESFKPSKSNRLSLYDRLYATHFKVTSCSVPPQQCALVGSKYGAHNGRRCHRTCA